MASSRSWNARLSTLASLSVAEWCLLLRARAWMTTAAIALHLLGFERTRRLLEPRAPTAAPPASDDAKALARFAHVVGLASRAGLRRHSCLPRSLVLQRLLIQRGHPAVLRIGVSRHGEKLAAHAWVEIHGETVGEAADVEERFAALFPRGPA